MSKIRFGMIGAGGISTAHLPAIAKREDAEIVCVSDINLDLARQRAAEYKAPRSCANYDELIAMSDIDAIIVGTPTQFHADAVLKAAKAGKHVLCEKPMARTVEDCQAMIDAHKAAGTVLAVGFVRRFDPNWGQVRKMVLEGKAGRPCMWRRIRAAPAPGTPETSRRWYSDSKLSDGPLPESGAHDIDFVRYTFGDVARVTAYMNHMSRFGDILDNSIVVLEFRSGDQAFIQWSWSLPHGATASLGGMDVIGPDGCIYEPRQKDGQWVAEVSKGGGQVEAVPFCNEASSSTGINGQLADFVNAIRAGVPPRATGLDGLKAQEVCVAAVQGMKEGRRIDLPRR